MTTAKFVPAATTLAVSANNRGNAKFSGMLSGGASLAALAAGLVLGGGLLTSQMATAQTTGIIATGSGPGALIVTAPADILEPSGDGINAHSSSGTDLTITSTAVLGSLDGIDADNNGTGALSITSTGTVSGTNGQGISAENGSLPSSYFYYNPPISYGEFRDVPGAGTSLTISAAAVSGGTDGIYVKNFGSGELSVTASGTVSGTSGRGIGSLNYGTDLTISATAVTGGTYGINARNRGTGALSVTATGTVTGANNEGIYASNNSPDGTDLTISAAAVTGNSDGIDARNGGSGALLVTATGAVTGMSSYGIRATNSSSGTDLDVSADDVSGGFEGIFAVNLGTGALSVTATGTVIGTSSRGIYANNSSYGTSLTILADEVTGGTNGIQARNNGTGALSVTATNSVAGTNNYGIYAYNDVLGSGLTVSSVAVSGGFSGIQARNRGTGAISITSTGAVTGTIARGIFANNSSYGTDLTISAASVSGGSDGIYARNSGTGALSITSTGTVTGTSYRGIYAYNGANGTSLTINADAVSGGVFGINAINNGTGALSITSDATVSGAANSGISATNFGTDLTISVAAVSGDSAGIRADNNGSGALSVTATGTVTGAANNGIDARNNSDGTDLTISAAAVSGNLEGIFARNKGSGDLSVTATGGVTGNYDGISAWINNSASTGNLTISATDVTGGYYGINARNDGTGALSVTVSGAVSGSDGAGIKTSSNAGGSVAINLLSTSSVGSTSGAAIVDGAGNAVVTIDAGAVVTGSIVLSEGNDTLNIASGTSLAGVTSLSGGTGAFTDTLNIKAGSSLALSDWEAINADTASGAFTLSSEISGGGTLTKTGAGALLLSGVNTLTGTTTVSGGTLNVTGSLADSATTVQTGATLGGTGTVGSLTALSGATIAPGMSIGTLSVNGDLLLNAGSTLAIEVSPTDADYIIVTGTATLGGTLSLIATGGTYVLDTSYTLLSASALTGTFSTITGFAGFGTLLDPTISYTGTDVILRFGLSDGAPPPAATVLIMRDLGSAVAGYVSSGSGPAQVNSGSVTALVDDATILVESLGAATGTFTNSLNTADAFGAGNRFGVDADLALIGSGNGYDGVAISTVSSNTGGIKATASNQEASSTLNGLTAGTVTVDGNSIDATTIINDGSTGVYALTLTGAATSGYVSLATGPATATLNDADNYANIEGTLAASNVQRSLSSDPSQAIASDNTVSALIQTATDGDVVAAVTLDDNNIGATFTGNTRTASFDIDAASASFAGTAVISNVQSYDGNTGGTVNALNSGSNIFGHASGSVDTATTNFNNSSLSVAGNDVTAAATGNVLAGTITLADGLAYNAPGTNTSTADLGGVDADMVATGALMIVSAQRNFDVVATAVNATTTGATIEGYLQQTTGSDLSVATNRITAAAKGNDLTTSIASGAGSASFDGSVTLAANQVADKFSVNGAVTNAGVFATVGNSNSDGEDLGNVVGSNVALSGNIVASSATGNTIVQTAALDATSLTLGSGVASLRVDADPALTGEEAIVASGAVTVSSVQVNGSGSAVSAVTTGTQIVLTSNDAADISAASSFSVDANIQQAFAAGSTSRNGLSLNGTTVGTGAGVANAQFNGVNTSSVTASLTGTDQLVITSALGDGVSTGVSAALINNRSEALATGVSSNNSLDVLAQTVVAAAASAPTALYLPSALQGAAFGNDAAYAMLNSQQVLSDVTASARSTTSDAAFLLDIGTDAILSSVANNGNRLTAQAQAITATNDIALDIGALSVSAEGFANIASVMNVQNVGDTADVLATATATDSSTVQTLVGAAVTDASLSTSSNRVTANAGGSLATSSLTAGGTTLAIGGSNVNFLGTTSAVATLGGPSSTLRADAAFALLNTQIGSTGSITATLRGERSEPAVQSDSALVLTDIGGAITGSGVVSSTNLFSAVASSNSTSNTLALDANTLETNAALMNGQSSRSDVSALIGYAGSSATRAGGVIIQAGDDITDSDLTVAGNIVEGSAIGNTANNVMTIAATVLTNSPDVPRSAGYIADGVFGANNDFVLTNVQEVISGGSSNSAVYSSFGIDQSLDQTLANSALSVSGNRLSSEAMANNALNSLAVTATDMASTGYATGSVASLQSGYSAAVNATSDLAAYANAASTGSTIQIDGNRNLAVGVINNVTNTLAAFGTNLAGAPADAMASTEGVGSAHATFELANAQITDASSTLNTLASLSVTNTDALNTATTGVSGGSVSLSGNTNFAEASANRALNSLSVGSGASNGATSALSNSQSSASTVGATATSNVAFTMHGAGVNNAAGTSSISVSGNATQAMARGNVALNALVHTAGAGFTSPTLGASITSASSTMSTAAATVLNNQTNSGAVSAAASNTVYAVALNGMPVVTGSAALNSTVAVSYNSVAAQAYGNQATNTISLATLNTGNAPAAVGSLQFNSGVITASATSVSFMINAAGAANASAMRTIGNSVTAQAIGNNVISSIGAR